MKHVTINSQPLTNESFIKSQQVRFYYKKMLESSCAEICHHILWYCKSYVIYLGNAYYGPKMLGVTYSNQKDDYIKNVEIGSRSGMVYGDVVSVEIENQSAQTVTILCRDKL